jgi:hypothetical protein
MEFARRDGLVRWYLPHPLPWFHGSLSSRDALPGGAEAVDEALAYFRGSCAGEACWWLDDGVAAQGWERLLMPRGFSLAEGPPGMDSARRSRSCPCWRPGRGAAAPACCSRRRAVCRCTGAWGSSSTAGSTATSSTFGRSAGSALVCPGRCRHHEAVDTEDILARIATTEAPLARQMLMTGLITRVLEQRGKPAPVLVGGLALSYYTREVYFTADIDLAYIDDDALDAALRELDFVQRGRYWIHEGLGMAVEAPASGLAGEDAPRETVEMEGGLRCIVIGLEDLIIDRLNACRHWGSDVDCEMAELLIVRYREELDWAYLERRAALPENDTLAELLALKARDDPREPSG